MSNTIETLIPLPLTELANAVIALEGSTDMDLAATGRLLTAAAVSGRAANLHAPQTQPVFELIGRIFAAKMEGRRELVAAHGQLRRLGKQTLPNLAWGPSEPCPLGDTKGSADSVEGLRVVA